MRAAAGFLPAGLLEKLTWRPDAPLLATYIWIATSGVVALLMVVVGVLAADGFGIASEILLRYQGYAEIRRAGVRVVVRSSGFGWRRGRLPQTLDELVPAYLKEVPRDVCTGRPLLYRLVDPASDPRKRSYLVYSTGNDGVDNGGNDGGANAFTPGYAAGVDAVINERR